MFKTMLVFIISIFLFMNLTGCVALLAAGAGGAGTAVWFSNKLTQEVDAPFDRTVSAAESALKSLRFPVKKKTVEQNVAQIISEYSDGKTIWVDIRRITEGSSKIDVRVGAIQSDKAAASKILNKIRRYL